MKQIALYLLAAYGAWMLYCHLAHGIKAAKATVSHAIHATAPVSCEHYAQCGTAPGATDRNGVSWEVEHKYAQLDDAPMGNGWARTGHEGISGIVLASK